MGQMQSISEHSCLWYFLIIDFEVRMSTLHKSPVWWPMTLGSVSSSFPGKTTWVCALWYHQNQHFSTVMILQTTAILVINGALLCSFSPGDRNGKALDSVVDHKLSREIQFYGYTVSLAVILHYQPHLQMEWAYPSLSGHLILYDIKVKKQFLD